MNTMQKIVLVCACLLCASTSTPGQPAVADAKAVEAAVATFLRDSFPSADASFDSRFKVNNKSGGERPLDRVESFARALGGRPAHKEDVLKCGASRQSCTLSTAAFFRLSAPTVSSSTATVTVEHVVRSGLERVPLTSTEIEITLRLTKGRWQVVSTQMLSSS